jgi:hypothetical protein
MNEMKNYQNVSAGRGFQAAALLAALLLSACGGGGGNPGAVTGGTGGGGTGTGGTGTGGTVVPATPTVSLAFTNTAGTGSNSLSGATPLTVKATVLDANKKPVPNAIVTFATDTTLAVFSPSAGTALTDANGVASVTMRSASLSAGGAGSVTASTSVAGAAVTGTGNYSVGATALSFGTLSATPASLQAYGSTVLSVDLLNGSTKYIDQQVNVTFSSACVAAGKATLATTVAANNGTAQTVYRDKGCGNNDTITVTADGVTKSATATLSIAPPAAASLQFVGATPTAQSIVIRGQGGNGRTETATLTFKVVDIFGNPLAGKAVNFSTTSSLVTINKTSDTTDAGGNVITTVNSGSAPTSFRVQATLPNTASGSNPDISTQSDLVVVTTGLPVQRAFSISADKFSIDGWNVDSAPASPAGHIQVLLADAFGNPVPDGTPIVFQTNMGSIGSADKGGCTTVNGGCSVDLRAQEPRHPSATNNPPTPCNTGTGSRPDATRVGLATICASSTDGTNTVFARTMVFFGGSNATKATVSGAQVSFDAANDLGAISYNDAKIFPLQLNDVNSNPMPTGTAVAIAGANNASVVVTPASVPNIALHNTTTGADDPTGTAAGNQGSVHIVSVTGTAPTPCVGKTATFSVTATTPSGSTTSIPFKLSFTCP